MGWGPKVAQVEKDMADAAVQSKPAAAEERNDRRTVQGVVQSIKMKKTITVLWTRQVKHPRYGKIMQRNTKLHAHDEKEEAKEGDLVDLMACRRLSKTKTWRLLRVVRKAHNVIVHKV